MVTLSPLSSSLILNKKVLQKSNPTEFEIQAFLYEELKKLGLEVRGEITWKWNHIQCRFDLAIFDGDVLLHIIEVKCHTIDKCTKETRQAKRYRNFGVPVTFIYGIEAAKKFINDLTI